MTKYEKAMLDTIAYAEGTLGVSQNGYDVLVGFPTIVGWTDNTTIRHRCVKPTSHLTSTKIKEKGGVVCEDESWDNKSLNSTAAGRYQFLGSSWATTTEKLDLGFNAPMTKDNQNKAALRAIKKKRKVTETQLKNAYSSFADFEVVREKLKNEWTSFKRNDSKAKKTPAEYWKVYKFAVKKYS
jgi:muramidase (phage lysozyme)